MLKKNSSSTSALSPHVGVHHVTGSSVLTFLPTQRSLMFCNTFSFFLLLLYYILRITFLSYILWFKKLIFSLRSPRQTFFKVYIYIFPMTRLLLPQIFLKMFSSFPFSDGFSDLMDLFYVPSKNIKNKKRQVHLHDSAWLINMRFFFIIFV